MVSEKDREDTQRHSHRETQGHRQRQREHAESNRKSSVSGRPCTGKVSTLLRRN